MDVRAPAKRANESVSTMVTMVALVGGVRVQVAVLVVGMVVVVVVVAAAAAAAGLFPSARVNG